MTVPHVGHLPLMALRPFFIVSSMPSAISFFALHLTQYPSAISLVLPTTTHHAPQRLGGQCGDDWRLRQSVKPDNPEGRNSKALYFRILNHTPGMLGEPGKHFGLGQQSWFGVQLLHGLVDAGGPVGRGR
jgi:hypothetical protein